MFENKGTEQTLRIMVGLIWETIKNLKCVLAMRFIMNKANNNRVVVSLPLNFWNKRQVKVEKLIWKIALDQKGTNEIFSDTIIAGYEQKIVAITIAPTAMLVIVYAGTATPETMAAFVTSIKFAINHIISNLLLQRE